MPSLHQAQLQQVYKPMIVGFVVLALALVAGVIYASAGGTTIQVTPTLSSVTSHFTITVGPAPAEAEASPDAADGLFLPGTVVAEPLTATVTATPTDDGAKVPAHATGSLTIKNTSSANQPLAAGTRLAHENGVVVRTTVRLDVPAHGEVTVTVVADPLGEEGQVPPGRFTIVALRPGNQALVFGSSTAALTGGLVSQSGSLSLEALTAASNEAEEKIRADFGTSASGTVKALVPVSVVTTPPADQPAASYEVRVAMTGLTITFDPDQLDALMTSRLTATLKDQLELASRQAPAITFDSRPTAETATVKIAVEGLAQIRADSPLLTSTQFAGLDRAAITKKLTDSGLVQSVAVTISPWWRSTASDQPAKITVTRIAP